MSDDREQPLTRRDAQDVLRLYYGGLPDVVLQAAISLRDNIAFTTINDGEGRIKAAKAELLKAKDTRAKSLQETFAVRAGMSLKRVSCEATYDPIEAAVDDIKGKRIK